MALFGLFKSKQEREFENAIQELSKHIFPGGEIDVIRDCERVNSITHGKIPQSELRGFVSGCKSLIHISKSSDDMRFVDSFIRRSNGRITQDEAFDMYAYFDGEASFYDAITLQVGKLGGDLNAVREAMFGDMPWTYSKGVRSDEIPDGHGEYGLSVSNPIPTISVRGSNHYLASLRYQGKPVEANRLGSTSCEITPGNIDIYTLSIGGESVGKVFICPYHKRNSKKAPRGFTLVNA